LLVQSDEIDDVTPRLAAETHEPLAFDIDEETGIPIRVERAQPLPPV
jgi:hypothetical protein